MPPLLDRIRPLALAGGFTYAVSYLWAIGDFSTMGQPAWDLLAGDPALWLQRREAFRFEPIAMLRAGHIAWLVNPLDILIATGLGALLAVNAQGAWILRHRPDICRGRAGGTRGALAAAPALLAGGACCAPGVLLTLGIPGLGAVAGLFEWLVPLSLLMLAANRWWQRRQGAPGWFRLPAARGRTRHVG